MPKLIKGLYKRGKYWWITWFDATGTQRWESCRTTNRQMAEAMLAKRQEEARHNILPEAPIVPVLLDTLREKYLGFCAHQPGVKTKAYHFGHFKRLWGNPSISALSVEGVDGYRAYRRSEGIGNSTINKELATLKHALSKAVEWKLLRKSFREDLSVLKKLRENPGRLRYISGEAEAERLIESCEPWLRPIVVIALNTGMRKGELLGLTWDCVDLTHGFIRLKQTKNGQARGLPMNEVVWGTFTQLHTQENGPWVFHDEQGRKRGDVRRPFNRATKAAGIHDFHFHDLRHSFASHLAMKGISITTIGNLLGHTSPTMTMRYAHLSPAHLTTAVRCLDSVFGKDKTVLHDVYMTKSPTRPPEPGANLVRNEGWETLEPLERTEESEGGAEAGI